MSLDEYESEDKPMEKLVETDDTKVEFLNGDESSIHHNNRYVKISNFKIPDGLEYNTKMQMDGLEMLRKLPSNSIPTIFLDPQYRGVLDCMSYGGRTRQKERFELSQMSGENIKEFVTEIERVLIPMGHLFLWMDLFHATKGDFREWFNDKVLNLVDMVIWDKDKMGMGYRIRKSTEYCMVLQKLPIRVKGVWCNHSIRDIYREKAIKDNHYHAKPINLSQKLIEATTNEGDVVVDPCAGSFSTLEACKLSNRKFIGCDLNVR